MKLWLALLSYSLLIPAVEAQTPASKLPASCRVQGQIVQQSGAQPIRKASIRLFSVGTHGEAEDVEYSAITDAEGRFGFDDVKSGGNFASAV